MTFLQCLKLLSAREYKYFDLFPLHCIGTREPIWQEIETTIADREAEERASFNELSNYYRVVDDKVICTNTGDHGNPTTTLIAECRKPLR